MPFTTNLSVFTYRLPFADTFPCVDIFPLDRAIEAFVVSPCLTNTLLLKVDMMFYEENLDYRSK